MAADDFAYVSAAELALRIRSKQVSPVELMDATIARIERRNPSLNALIFTDFDGARVEAKKAEAAVMSGAVGVLLPSGGGLAVFRRSRSVDQCGR